ncbi:MAG: hypothetical protein AAB552_02615 [Patescibacteria group bacterium]
MHRMRFFSQGVILGTLFALPVFIFAQTTTGTSTAEKTALQEQLDTLVQSRINQLSSPAQIRINAIRDYLEITTSPKYPKPNELVRITIESYLTDLNKATLAWSVNGDVVTQGIGKKTFSFNNGASGKTTRVSVLIRTNGGEVVVKEFSFSPIGVTILWEADTYTPPFYKGKPLASAQSSIRAVAIPDTGNAKNILGAGNLVYVWKKNGNNVSEASGYAKNSFTFTAPKPYDEASVGVQVSPIDSNTVKSETRVNVPLSNPFVMFYEKHPLEGVRYDRPLGTKFALSGKEVTLRAEPYFFSNESGNKSTLSYQWSLNGKKTSNQGRTITLKNDKGVKGDSTISIAIHGITQTFQSGSKSIMLHFGENTDSDIERPIF